VFSGVLPYSDRGSKIVMLCPGCAGTFRVMIEPILGDDDETATKRDVETSTLVESATTILSTCTCRNGANQHGSWRVIDESCPACGSAEGKARALYEAGLLNIRRYHDKRCISLTEGYEQFCDCRTLAFIDGYNNRGKVEYGG
jgi:hypothetical protein